MQRKAYAADYAMLVDVAPKLLGDAKKDKLGQSAATVHENYRREREDQERIARHKRARADENAEESAAGVAHKNL